MRNFSGMTAILLMLAVLSGCNNGPGSSSTSSAPPPIPTGTVAGISFDGLINGATISVYDYSKGTKGDLLASATSDNAGLYSLKLQIESRPLLVEVTKGVYVEEADSKQVTIGKQTLSALVNYTTNAALQVSVTPLTHIAAALANYEIKNGTAVAAAIDDANKRIGNIFTIDIINTTPKQITDIANATVALSPEIKYGFISAALSDWTMNNSPAAQNTHVSPYASIDLLQTMYADILADGKLDGMGLDSSGNPIQLSFGTTALSVDTYRYQLAMALIDVAKNTNNKTGITDVNILSFAQTIGSNADKIFAGATAKAVTMPVPPAAVGSVSGITYDGLIAGGTVNIYDYSTGTKGNVLGTAKTDNAGLYSVSLQITSRPVLIEITGGYYVEEATGQTKSLGTNPVQKLTALVNYTEGTPIQTAVTTFSHLAAGLANYEINKGTAVATAIDDANNRFSAIMGVSVTQTIPKQITDPTNASVALSPELKYGFLAGAISMWVKNNAPNFYSIDFAQAAYGDISVDGKLDGIGLDSLGKPIQLGLGTAALSTDIYRYWMGVNLIKMAADGNNKTQLLGANVLGYAKSYIASTDAIFGGLTPKTINAPTVSINQPSPFVRKTVNITANNSSDLGLSYVELLVNGVSVNNTNNPGAMLSPLFGIDTTKYSDGSYNVSIRTTDIAGVQTVQTIGVYFDNTPPVIPLTATQSTCAGCPYVGVNTRTFSGTVQDNPLNKVTITFNTVGYAAYSSVSVPGNSTWTFSITGNGAENPPLPWWPQLVATDQAGNCSQYQYSSYDGSFQLLNANYCP